MVSVITVTITITSLFFVALVAAALFVRRKRMGFTGPNNISVSRQWLMQHQADDRS